MTRSVPQPPTSPGAESGSAGGETTAEATPATRTDPVVRTDSGVVTDPEVGTEPAAGAGRPPEPGAAPDSAAGTQPAAAGVSAAEGGPTEPEAPTASQSGVGSEAGTGSGTAVGPESGADSGGGNRSEAEGDPGAAAAAKSRLPALVRTMTATAIDRPQRETGPVGRPGKAVLAGAAVAGALLVSVPLLMLGGNDDKDRGGSASAGTVLGGNAQEAPGEFAAATPATGSPGPAAKESAGRQGKPVVAASTSAPAKDEGDGGTTKNTGEEKQPAKRGGDKKAADAKDPPAKAGSGVTLSAPVSLRSHLSGRCVDVPDGDFADGRHLVVWDCNGGPAQKWQFASDGTVRIKGKCLDVADANYNDGTPVQIAWCSGNAAQKFVLNASHDLVNTVVGKCVDIKDNNRGNGAPLQLWSCAGTDNQKWSV